MPVIYEGIVPDSRGLHYIIKTGGKGDLTVNTSKGMRAIRYASNQKSQFLDEQNKFAKLGPVIMREGFLTIADEDTALIDFMDIHPHKNKIFQLMDPEAEALADMLLEEAVLDVKAAIRAKSLETHGDVYLASLLVVKSSELTPDQVSQMGSNQVRKSLYNLAKTNPLLFTNSKGKVNCFTDKSFIRQDLVIRAINEEIININPAGTSMSWDGTGEEILAIPRGKNYREYFADFFLDPEGEKVMNAIGSELKKLYK